MCSPKMLCSLSLFFSRQLTFTLLAASISHSLTAVMKFFFFQRNSSHLFLITRSSSFHVIQVSVDKKNNVEKGGSTLLLFFLSKSPGGHAISRQNTSSCLWCHTRSVSYFTLVCLWYGTLVCLLFRNTVGFSMIIT